MRRIVYFRFEFWPTADGGVVGYEDIKPAMQSTSGRILNALQANGPAGLNNNSFTTSDNMIIVMITDVSNMQVI